MYLERQSFFVLGLSRSGVAAANFLLERGAKVFLYDDVVSDKIEESIRALEERGAKRVLKEEVSRIHERVDALVLSPGIPIDHPVPVAFRKAKKGVLGETELAVRHLSSSLIAVTGTNGKTTTVSMIESILKAGGKKAFACGNIGSPIVDFCKEEGIAVAEISSFQLETLNSHQPHISVVLNVTEDHLNRHYNMENYVFLKSKLLKNCTECEFAVLNYDDETVRAFAERTKAKIVYFSLRHKVNGGYYENGNLYYCGEKIISSSELITDGVHNIQNALAAIVVAKLLGVETSAIAKALQEFKGIKHRIETVATVNGVKYVNDSKATNVDATIKAVGCMKNSTVLLLGGKDKGYDYDGLFTALNSSNVHHAVLYGENRFRLLESAARAGYGKITLCSTFYIAVRVAEMLATSGQTVLLSPASASFDEFSSYEERGARFISLVQEFEQKSKVEPTQLQLSLPIEKRESVEE